MTRSTVEHCSCVRKVDPLLIGVCAGWAVFCYQGTRKSFGGGDERAPLLLNYALKYLCVILSERILFAGLRCVCHNIITLLSYTHKLCHGDLFESYSARISGDGKN